MQCPVNSYLIDHSLKTLSTAANFLFINLFNGDFCVGSEVTQSANGIVAWTCEIYYSKRSLSQKVLKLVVGVNTCSHNITIKGLLPLVVILLLSSSKLNSSFTFIFWYLEAIEWAWKLIGSVWINFLGLRFTKLNIKDVNYSTFLKIW